MKNKAEFISELLNTNRLNIDDKERIIKLTSKEIESGSKEFDKIWKEINNLKSLNLNEIKSEEEPEFILEHNPQKLIKLLSNFSNNNHPLKYACHSWDYGNVEGRFDNYFDFLNKLDKEGKSICFEILKIKKQLGTPILHFLFTENEKGKYSKKNIEEDYTWGEYNLKYGWRSKEIIIQANEDPKKDPFEFKIKQAVIINGNNISYFKQIVDIFKNSIEIRRENNQLKMIMQEMKKKHLGIDFKIKYENLEGKQFYTDVHSFKRALNKIFIEISKRTHFPNIIISANDNLNEKYTEIKIIQLESSCKEIYSDEMINEVEDGDFNDINNYLRNLCDWSIETNFKDGNYEINYLTSNPINKVLISETKGFSHKFKFYKH